MNLPDLPFLIEMHVMITRCASLVSLGHCDEESQGPEQLRQSHKPQHSQLMPQKTPKMSSMKHG